MHIGSYEPLVDTSPAAFHVGHNKRAAEKSADEPDRKRQLIRFARVQTGVSYDHSGQLRRAGAQLTDLPCETVHHIAKSLDIRSISAPSQTCHCIHDVLHDMAIDTVARSYYGAPGSESRHLYDALYTPLAKRLGQAVPGADSQAMPLTEEQQERQRLHHITRLRTLSQNGKLKPTCQFFEEDGFFLPLTAGFSAQWGECALLIHDKQASDLQSVFDQWREWSKGKQLKIVVLEPSCSFVAVPPLQQLDSHSVLDAHILADGSIATRGIVGPDGQAHHILTVCRHNQRGDIEHVILAGHHSDTIVRFEQLPDGRVVSASYDGSLKVRPLERAGEDQVITLTGHLDKITDMLLLSASRCITSSCDCTLKIWDLGTPSKERCVATLTDTPRTITQLYRLSKDHFLSETPPNIMLIWRLTDSGAVCTALLDPDWDRQLLTTEQRTGKEPPYDLQVKAILDLRSYDKTFAFKILPDSRVVLHHWSDTRICEPTGLHSEPRRNCILARDKSGAVTHSVPICPVGPPLRPRPTFWAAKLLPDGRLVYAERNGTLHTYCPDSAKGIQLCNLFSCLPKNHEPRTLNIEWMLHTGSGRLLISCVNANEKTLFFSCDPYRQSEKPDCPTKEHSPHACHII